MACSSKSSSARTSILTSRVTRWYWMSRRLWLWNSRLSFKTVTNARSKRTLNRHFSNQSRRKKTWNRSKMRSSLRLHPTLTIMETSNRRVLWSLALSCVMDGSYTLSSECSFILIWRLTLSKRTSKRWSRSITYGLRSFRRRSPSSKSLLSICCTLRRSRLWWAL